MQKRFWAIDRERRILARFPSFDARKREIKSQDFVPIKETAALWLVSKHLKWKHDFGNIRVFGLSMDAPIYSVYLREPVEAVVVFTTEQDMQDFRRRFRCQPCAQPVVDASFTAEVILGVPCLTRVKNAAV